MTHTVSFGYHRDEDWRLIQEEAYVAELCSAFGRNLKRQRQDLEISQGEVASRCGTTRKSVSQIERGGSQKTSLVTLAKLSLAVGLEFPSMFKGKKTVPAAPE